MTVREQAHNIINQMSEKKLRIYVSYLNDMQQINENFLEEMLDDKYCLDLYQQAKSDPENTEGISIEDYAKKWGIDLDNDDAD